MALTDFKPHFDNAYQEVFNKVLVAKKVGNFRFEPVLKYGESVERVAYDISNVVVRPTVRGAISTIDTVTDSAELLTVNLEYEAAFHISDGEATQAGPLNPGEVIGGQIAIKGLRKDIKNDIDTICSLVNEDDMKLRVAVMSLRKDIALLQTLTRSKKNLDLALEALEEVDE